MATRCIILSLFASVWGKSYGMQFYSRWSVTEIRIHKRVGNHRNKSTSKYRYTCRYCLQFSITCICRYCMQFKIVSKYPTLKWLCLDSLLYPATKLMGVYWIHPVRPSVCPSIRPPGVGVQVTTFFIGYQFYLVYVSLGWRYWTLMNMSVILH